ncbi:flavin reductase family protein [Lacihabitans soyangensis]|uniref:Flavin reductase family protein n=1 Tax=Lacihabitans soyangensis TaxID=869394 RepID=A0AAE3KST6_9BACT|nr:flavin reductase family protein [Lacihabitans soyangensis]MCP9761571.1 flavin reductase family protein [Lacihabitans soyangensis]
MLTINPKEVSVAVLHGYLQSSIAPRPIAFASTIDKDGNVNLSPFSFFNVFGTNPPTLIFSPNRRVRDGSQKHTLENVLEHDEVVINMVDFAMVEQMSLASCEYEKGINEFVKSGFTEAASVLVKPPRVLESKAAFECKVKQVVQMSEEGGSPNLVICEIVLAHFSEDILDENGKIDQTKTDWVARLGGDWYVRASGDALFEVAKPSIHKGIGVDAIPDFIKHDSSFSGNDLGRLGNIEELPSVEEINDFMFQNPNANYKEMAKVFLINGKIKEAWMALLSQ